jgi:hypothetical protein
MHKSHKPILSIEYRIDHAPLSPANTPSIWRAVALVQAAVFCRLNFFLISIDA